MATTYDSTRDTIDHIQKVRTRLFAIVSELLDRALKHDMSKLDEPEKSIYDLYTPQLKFTEYGTDAYKSVLKKMQIGIDHHYSVSPHHPEYYLDGFSGMNLIDIMEMLADWKSATERMAKGDLKKSIDINCERFHIDEQLKQILLNTAGYLGWL